MKVSPRASRNAILGVESDWLRVALTAPPVDGKANEAARRLLAETLGIPRATVTLLSGQASRIKRFALEGIPSGMVLSRFPKSLTED